MPAIDLQVLGGTNHVESRLGKRVVCTRENFLERADCVLERHEFAFVASEDLGDLERLGHETLDLASTFDLKEM